MIPCTTLFESGGGVKGVLFCVYGPLLLVSLVRFLSLKLDSGCIVPAGWWRTTALDFCIDYKKKVLTRR